jgi:hypothetical protein
MEVSVMSRGYVKRVRRDLIPSSFSVLCFALIVGVLFAAPSAPAGGPYGKIDLVLAVHDADGHSVPKFEAMIHTHHEGYIR